MSTEAEDRENAGKEFARALKFFMPETEFTAEAFDFMPYVYRVQVVCNEKDKEKLVLGIARLGKYVKIGMLSPWGLLSLKRAYTNLSVSRSDVNILLKDLEET